MNRERKFWKANDQPETTPQKKLRWTIDGVIFAIWALPTLPMAAILFWTAINPDPSMLQHIESLNASLTHMGLVLTTFSLLLVPLYSFRILPKLEEFWLVLSVTVITIMVFVLHSAGHMDPTNRPFLSLVTRSPWLPMLLLLIVPLIVCLTTFTFNWTRPRTIRRISGYGIITLHLIFCLLHISTLSALRKLNRPPAPRVISVTNPSSR